MTKETTFSAACKVCATKCIRHMNSSDSKHDALPSFRLDGRLAVITGASDGIGRAFALAYSRSGAEVVLVSRTREKLLEVQRSIEAAGGRAHVIRADVAKIEDIRSIEREVSAIVIPGQGSRVNSRELRGLRIHEARTRYHRRRLGPYSGRPRQGHILLLPIFGASNDRARLRQDHQSEFDLVVEHGHGQKRLRYRQGRRVLSHCRPLHRMGSPRSARQCDCADLDAHGKYQPLVP